MSSRASVISARSDSSIEEFENEIEALANAKDISAGFYVRNSVRKIRKYNVGILRNLKRKIPRQVSVMRLKTLSTAYEQR